MSVTVASFKADFPEFVAADEGKVTFWLSIATALVSWPALNDQGIELLTAHYLAGDPGVTPGAGAGIIASASVGGVSKSYDLSTSSEPDAGELNRTEYGRRYAALRKMAGMGGLQLGVGYPGLGPWQGGYF